MNQKAPKPQTTWFKKFLRMRGEHTSLPTACHSHLSHLHSTCGYWVRDITGYSTCAYPLGIRLCIKCLRICL